eukprot:513677_1
MFDISGHNNKTTNTVTGNDIINGRNIIKMHGNKNINGNNNTINHYHYYVIPRLPIQSLPMGFINGINNISNNNISNENIIDINEPPKKRHKPNAINSVISTAT